MIPPSFFRRTAVRELLARASRAAATPVALHPLREGEEGLRITGLGQCAACKYVGESPQGLNACRASRARASAMAVRRRRPVPFVCHVGFSCVAMAALPGVEDSPYVLTFGPYCPSEVPDALEHDVAARLAALGLEHDPLPFALDDVPRIPASVVPAVAEWTADALGGLAVVCDECDDVEQEDAPEEGNARQQGAKRGSKGTVASAWTVFLESGDRAALRRMAESALVEAGASLDAWRGRAVEVIGEVIQQQAQDKGKPSAWWGSLPERIGRLAAAQNQREVLSELLHTLGDLTAAPKPAPKATFLRTLQDFVRSRLPEAVPLEEAARVLGVQPSAVSHRLLDAFGVSYTEFVNRQRVEHAKELFRRTRLSIEEVALRVGVNGASYLSRLFARFEGMPPGEYRRRFSQDKEK